MLREVAIRSGLQPEILCYKRRTAVEARDRFIFYLAGGCIGRLSASEVAALLECHRSQREPHFPETRVGLDELEKFDTFGLYFFRRGSLETTRCLKV